jgi:hypothetical protein
MTEQERARLMKAAENLQSNPDLTLVLTSLKNECIQEFKRIDLSELELRDIHRRFVAADDLESRIKNYAHTF